MPELCHGAASKTSAVALMSSGWVVFMVFSFRFFARGRSARICSSLPKTTGACPTHAPQQARTCPERNAFGHAHLWACLETDGLSVKLSVSFRASSRSRKSVLCLVLHTAFLRTMKTERPLLHLGKREFSGVCGAVAAQFLPCFEARLNQRFNVSANSVGSRRLANGSDCCAVA